MVKIKLIKAAYPDEEKWVGKVYEAFEIENNADGIISYATHIESDLILWVRPENCEVIEDTYLTSDEEKIHSSQPKLLLVEDGSVDTDELAEWCCDNNIKLIIYRHGANKPEFLNY